MITANRITEGSKRIQEPKSRLITRMAFPIIFFNIFTWYIVIDSSNSHLQLYLLLSINPLVRG